MEGRFEKLTESFQNAGIELNQFQIQQFMQYADLLTFWNTRINLTAITDFEEVVSKHFIDSVWPFLREKQCFADMPETPRLVDVGSGAGFPGIPLKICFPDWDICLVDSLGKRVNFLEKIIEELNLTHISAHHGRAEDLGKDPAFREQFDIATARAVAPLNILAEYCLPFVKVGGCFVAYKGPRPFEEALQTGKVWELLGADMPLCLPYCVRGAGDRSLIVAKKLSPTAAAYPRRPGMAEKKPLG